MYLVLLSATANRYRPLRRGALSVLVSVVSLVLGRVSGLIGVTEEEILLLSSEVELE